MTAKQKEEIIRPKGAIMVEQNSQNQMYYQLGLNDLKRKQVIKNLLKNTEFLSEQCKMQSMVKRGNA